MYVSNNCPYVHSFAYQYTSDFSLTLPVFSEIFPDLKKFHDFSRFSRKLVTLCLLSWTATSMALSWSFACLMRLIRNLMTSSTHMCLGTTNNIIGLTVNDKGKLHYIILTMTIKLKNWLRTQ